MGLCEGGGRLAPAGGVRPALRLAGDSPGHGAQADHKASSRPYVIQANQVLECQAVCYPA